MQDVSGTGLSLTVSASGTYPSGFICKAFADDSDPLDFPELQITEYVMGLNGDLVVWSAPKPLEVSISVIPGTDEENYLDFLFEANRVAKGKRSNKDVITFIANYPDGTRKVLAPGRITKGLPGNSVASGGRIKTKKYSFVFENKV